MTISLHLARRFFLSLSRREPAAADVDWAHQLLLPAEAALWDRMVVQDKRHSIMVARRFADMAPEAGRAELAGALLHDVGKVDCGLGTFQRVVATMVGPRTRRFRHYRDHERIGVELLRAAGSVPATIDLVTWQGAFAATLMAADDL